MEITSILSGLATIASILLFASPLEEFKKVKATGNKRGQTILPIVFMWINCCLWGLYGGQVQLFVVIYINLIGCCFSVYYLHIWISVSQGVERVQLALILLGAGGFVGWSSLYANDYLTGMMLSGAVSHDVNYLPIFANIINVLMFASPLVQIKKVIEERNSNFLNYRLSLMSVINCVAWLGLSLLYQDMYMFIPNFLGLILSAAQLMLYFKYYTSVPSSSPNFINI